MNGVFRRSLVVVFLAATTLPAPAIETLCPKYGDCVPASLFTCEEIVRSSLITRVCYNEPNRYMIVRLKRTDYHYCEIGSNVIAEFLAAESMGRFYNQQIKVSSNDGLYDCRTKGAPKLVD